MMEILNSEFFWGIVVGLVLSFFGGWLQARLISHRQQQYQKQMVKIFYIDTIRNIQKIIQEMDTMRDQVQLIHHDFLDLIDNELSVYGRNREHLILLHEEIRDKVRAFMNDCAIKRANIVSNLENYYRDIRLSDQTRVGGSDAEADVIKKRADEALKKAQTAADKLTTNSSTASGLLDDLSKL